MIEQITLAEWLQAMQSAPKTKEPKQTQRAEGLSKSELLYRVILRGSGFENGKERIAKLYGAGMERNKRADAICKEYGVGGVGGEEIIKEAKEIRAYSTAASGLYIEHITAAGEREKLVCTWLEVEEQIQRAICLHEYETKGSRNEI